MFIREIISLVSRHAKYQPSKINPVTVTHSAGATEQKEGVATSALRHFNEQTVALKKYVCVTGEFLIESVVTLLMKPVSIIMHCDAL